MTHPLTNEMIGKLVEDVYETDFNDCEECEDTLFARAAYDLGQGKGREALLNEVIEWLDDSLPDYLCLFKPFLDEHIFAKCIIEDFKEEMRPQQLEDKS